LIATARAPLNDHHPSLAPSCPVALVVAVGRAWFSASIWPLAGLALVLALAALFELRDLRRDVTLARVAAYPPMWTKYAFALKITDRLPEALGLTAEERVALAKAPFLPAGIVLEEWQGFRRWRLKRDATEVTHDAHGVDDPPSHHAMEGMSRRGCLGAPLGARLADVAWPSGACQQE
jgi:hypothetical protein